MYVWGGGSDGQLGLGSSQTEVTKPTLLPIDQPVVHIACGYYHTAVITGNAKQKHIIKVYMKILNTGTSFLTTEKNKVNMYINRSLQKVCK